MAKHSEFIFVNTGKMRPSPTGANTVRYSLENCEGYLEWSADTKTWHRLSSNKGFITGAKYLCANIQKCEIASLHIWPCADLEDVVSGQLAAMEGLIGSTNKSLRAIVALV